ncbi:protein-tyrosine-phosphatase [Lentilactobacillus fungorum]|uniref:Protein-tyrosine-phosphatase n=1 Tax=Lentilactobacillus fungorum TaxID=2201250 RepID=A0ABQ3W0Q4_9LACO|nr:tyrosine-protein phosphatase [Lentilactobacillus fungorum]GHP14112.1 protein-tyrosine-phosphatase [Lentilactobacillus fungorum]
MSRWKQLVSLLIVAMTGLSWASVSTNASTTPTGSTIQLSGTYNTQDLGGIRTKNGLKIKKNRLIRSDALAKLTNHDRWKLTYQIGLRTVFDFRSIGEINRAKDNRLKGVHYRVDSVMANSKFGVHTVRTYANQLANQRTTNMLTFYQRMVIDKHCIHAYRQLMIQLLKQHHDALLYHCTYGKDRTGIATMLILVSLGVPKKTIIANYLKSNAALKPVVHQEFQQLKRATHNRRALANFKRAREAKTSYLNAAYRAINRHYGSMNHYLNDAMGLSVAKIHRLRQLYLTK